MRIFVTGATGFLGSAIVQELIHSGHRVLGLARSEASARSLAAAGAEVYRGNLEDLDSLQRGVAMAEAVIHTAFNHDFSRYVANCEADRHVIEVLGATLAGTDRPLIITSGTGMADVANGRLATEEDSPLSSTVAPRGASEEAAASVAAQGVPVIVVRLPQVHDTVKQGLVSYLVSLAREKGVSAYVGDGLNRWPAVHRRDAARVYQLALEKGTAGSKYHAVGEQGVALRTIAEVIGRGLSVPVVSLASEDAAAHFGWLAGFAGRDVPASSAQTQMQLGWNPTGPGLVADLEHAAEVFRGVAVA